MAWLTSPPGTSHVQLARAATKNDRVSPFTSEQHRYVLTSCCRFDWIPLCRLVSNFNVGTSARWISLVGFPFFKVSEYLRTVLLISGLECQLDIVVALRGRLNFPSLGPALPGNLRIGDTKASGIYNRGFHALAK